MFWQPNLNPDIFVSLLLPCRSISLNPKNAFRELSDPNKNFSSSRFFFRLFKQKLQRLQFSRAEKRKSWKLKLCGFISSWITNTYREMWFKVSHKFCKKPTFKKKRHRKKGSPWWDEPAFPFHFQRRHKVTQVTKVCLTKNRADKG